MLNRWWLVISLPTILGFAGYFYSSNQESVYEAKATILVQGKGGGIAFGASDFRLSSELAATYSRRVTAKPFLDTVPTDGELPFATDSLPGMVSATIANNPPIVELRIRHASPDIAAKTAQMVAERFIDYTIEQELAEIARVQAAAQGIVNIDDLVAAQFSTLDTLEILEPVSTPGTPVLPRTRLNVAAGALLGFLVAVGAAFLWESMTDTVRFPEQLSQRFGVTSLGTIFRWSTKEVADDDMVLWSAPSSRYAEALRQVRANLQFANARQPGKLFLVTSPGPGEGKTTILSNLSIALAQTGKRVLIVDGDLRRPSVHRFFPDAGREPGLSNYLADLGTSLADAIRQTVVEGVDIIPNGPTPPNPAELLGSPRMATLLSQTREEYDAVLVDTPPMLLVADGSILASQVEKAVVIVDGSGTKASFLQAALDTLRSTNVEIAGVIINKLKRPRFGYGYNCPYYYYSSYGYYAETQESASPNGRIYERLAHRVKSALSRSRDQ